MGASIPQADPALVARARRGDAQAHARLYEIFAPMVYTVARRMLGAAAPAEDVLQETFVEVIRKMRSYRGEAEIGFWIRRIGVNKSLMHLRSGWVARRVDDESPDLRPADGRAGGAAEQQLDLEKALARLSDTARAVVWLHDVEGYTHQEIGRMMGRTVSFSKSQLARAHERLRALLEEEVAGDSSEERVVGLSSEEPFADACSEERDASAPSAERVVGAYSEERVFGASSDERGACASFAEGAAGVSLKEQPSESEKGATLCTPELKTC